MSILRHIRFAKKINPNAGAAKGAGRKGRAFTLLELIIVIAVVSVLASAAAIIINPAEILAEARDAERISDARLLYQNISLLKNSNPRTFFGSQKTVYISLPDDAGVSCPSHPGLPSLPSDWSYRCAPSFSFREVGGSGWIPANLLSISGGSPISSLPIDSDNTSASGRYYMYIPDGLAFAVAPESVKHLRGTATRDGGYDFIRYEVGKDLSVFAIINRLAGIWSFEEAGSSAGADSGISGNNGVVFGSPSAVAGVSGSAISFDGIDDYIRVANQTGDTFSISFWLKAASSLTGVACSAGSGLISSDIQGVGNDFSVTLVNGHICFFTGNPDESVEGVKNVADSAWHHIVVGRERGGFKNIYVDGALDRVGLAGNNVLNNNQNIEFGTSTVTGKYFNGSLDEVVVYNRILSPAEISALYNSGAK